MDRMNQIEKYGTQIMRSCAERVSAGIVTGHDWPNDQGELNRLQAASLLCEAADKLDSAPPDCRGYAALGTGRYLLNHSAGGEPPELLISIATDEQRDGRTVGDLQDNEPGATIHPNTIAVRLAFATVSGLDALEQQLSLLREAHFPASQNAQAKLRRVAFLDAQLRSPNIHRESARELLREKNQILYGSDYVPDYVFDDEDPPEVTPNDQHNRAPRSGDPG